MAKGSPRSTPSRDLQQLEERLGHTFQQLSLLERALTHSSFAYENAATQQPSRDYEALEFLGDAVLDLLISEYLVRKHPDLTEGQLSRIRSFLVSTSHLASLSKSLELGDFLRLGHGEEKTGGRKKKALLADLFESLVAAIYLDGGLESARLFVVGQFEPFLQRITSEEIDVRDPKSVLQEKLHARGLPEPCYRVIEETGPDHKKSFTVEVHIEGKSVAQAVGGSKKTAQLEAARLALEQMGESG